MNNEAAQKQDDPVYPSQNEDFLSFNNIASTSRSTSNAEEQFNYGGNNTPYNNFTGAAGQYRNRFQQQNYNNFQSRKRNFTEFRQNNNDDFNINRNRYSGQRSYFERFNNQNNFRQYRGRDQSHNSKNMDVTQYYHFTMLEDPWKDLLERHNALSKSFINNEEDENLDGFYIEKNSEPSSDDDDDDDE